MRLETRQIMVTVATIVGFLSFGGCVGKPKEQTKPINHIASSSTKEDKKAIKQKQLAYLKEHEQEMTAYVKAHNANIHQVSYDWDSIKTVVGGNGTPQGGGYNLSISGQINQLENTKFSVDFYLEDQNSIPTIKKMGMLNDIYIEENGGWKIFS